MRRMLVVNLTDLVEYLIDEETSWDCACDLLQTSEIGYGMHLKKEYVEYNKEDYDDSILPIVVQKLTKFFVEKDVDELYITTKSV